MNAIVSGGLRAAVLHDAGALLWLDERTGEALPCTEREVRRLVLDATDAVLLENVNQGGALEVLKRATALHAALTQLSIAVAVDDPVSDEERVRALTDLERLVSAEATRTDVRNVLHGTPPGDVRPALALAGKRELGVARAILGEIRERAPTIEIVCQAWSRACAESPRDEQDQTRARSWAVRAGLFRSLVEATLERRAVRSADDLTASIRDTAWQLEVTAEPLAVADLLGRWLEEMPGGLNTELLDGRQRASQLLDDLRARVPYARASIQLLDEDERTMFVVRGFPEQQTSRSLLRPVSHDPLIARVFAGRRPFFLEDPGADKHWTAQPDTQDVAAWIGAPIMHREIPVGLLTLDFLQRPRRLQDFGPTIASFSQEIADTLWNAGPEHRRRRAEQDMKVVNRVIQVISAKLDPRTVLGTIATEIALNLDCTHCTIFEPEGRGAARLLVPQFASGGDARSMQRRFRVDEGLVGAVFSSGRTLIEGNATEHPRFAPGRSGSPLTRSMLVAPIKVGDQTIGVVCADQDAAGWFKESDGRLVDALAQQAGIAIQRARALNLMQEIAQKILVLRDVREILREVVTRAVELVNASNGVIYLFDSSQTPIRLVETVRSGDFVHPEPRLNKEDGITRTVIRTGRSLIVADMRHDARVNQALLTFASLIAVPLKIKNEVVGVLFVDDVDRHAFSETEQSLLELLAAHSSIALHHDQLERQLEGLREVSKAQDLERVLDKVAEGIRAILGPEVSPIINLFEPDTGTFESCHGYGPLAQQLRIPPRPDVGTAAHVLRHKKAIYLPDVSAPPPGVPTLRDESLGLGIVSFAAVPLQSQGLVLGILFVNAQKALGFAPDEQRVIELFANQAAAAIENARNFGEIRKRLNTFAGLVSASLDDQASVYDGIAADLKAPASDAGKVRLLHARLKEATSHLRGLAREFEKALPHVLDKVRTSVNGFLQDEISEFRLSEPDFEFELIFDDTLPEVELDRTYMGRALREVLLKAGRASLPSSAEDRGRVRVVTAPGGDQVIVRVENAARLPQGSDLPEATSTRVEEIIQAHGGRIDSYASEGTSGAGFVIHLPM